MLNPLKLKDYVTIGNILGGVAAMVAAFHGNLDWACIFMVIAWGFDSVDGVVARMTGGGNKFGSVLDNTADLVAYSLAPTMVIYLAFVSPRLAGGAGWPTWAAFPLAALPTVFGCIRFARNDTKDIIMPLFHMGLPRTVYGLYIATLFTSHLFRNPWIADADSIYNPVLYALAALLIAITSLLTFTLIPYYAKPMRGGANRPFILFSTGFFLVTNAIGIVAAVIFTDLRIFADTLFVNFTSYVWFQFLAIPPEKRREVRRYVDRLKREWKSEMG
jgi:phosphatidylserine synthase